MHHWDFSDKFDVKANQLTVEASELMTQAQRNEVLLHALEVYYDFLAADLYYRTYEILLVQARQISDQMQQQVESGLQYESDYLLALSNYNHLRIGMLDAKADYVGATATLVRLLNLSPTTILVAADSILLPLELIAEDDLLSTEISLTDLPYVQSQNLFIESLELKKLALRKEIAIPEFSLGLHGSAFGDLFTPIGPRAEINSALTWKIPIGRLAYGGDYKLFDSQINLIQDQN